MYKSIETRWFFDATAKEAGQLEKWFSSLREWPNKMDSPAMRFHGHKSRRTDYYLDLDGYPQLSFKIREGRTEIKVLDEDLGLMKFHSRASGRVGKWIKWGPSLKSKDAGPELFANPKQFKTVVKERLLIKYESDGRKKPRRVDPERMDLKGGCQVELTRIQYQGKSYYSFGFEAFGEERSLMSSFSAVCNMTLQDMRHIRLSASRSYGYPGFLGR